MSIGRLCRWPTGVERRLWDKDHRISIMDQHFRSYPIRRSSTPSPRARARVEKYMSNSMGNPRRKVAFFIQLLEGSTLEACNLYPLFACMRYLQERSRVIGFVTTQMELHMKRILDAGDKLIDSLVEVQKKVVEELDNGLLLTPREVRYVYHIWKDVTGPVERFLILREELIKTCNKEPIREIAWVDIFIIIGALVVAILVAYLAVRGTLPPHDVVNTARNMVMVIN